MPGSAVKGHLRRLVSALPCLYPVVFAEAVVVSAYVGSAVDLRDALRLVAITGLLTLAIEIVASAFVGLERGAVVTLAVLGLFFIPLLAALIVLGVLVGSAWNASRSRRGRAVRLPQRRTLSRGLAAMAAILIALVILDGVQMGALGLPIGRNSVPLGPAHADLPDIYVLLLDGHARQDTLATKFNVDERAWIRDLESRGFFVASASHSNYTWTPLTLLSMLHGKHVDELVPKAPDRARAQWRLLMTRLGQNLPAFDALRRAGYLITTVPTPYVEYGLKQADSYLDSGNLNSLELDFLRHSVAAWLVPDLFSEQIRLRTIAAMNDVVAFAKGASGHPRLLFAHFLIPHPPYVFRSDGTSPGPPYCFPGCSALHPPRGDREARLSGYTGQLEFTHDMVISLVDTVQRKSSRQPIIVVFSDHGSREFPADPPERLRNFFAAYTPGHPGIFSEVTSPIEIFSKLFAAYGIADFSTAEDRLFLSSDSKPWPMDEWLGAP